MKAVQKLSYNQSDRTILEQKIANQITLMNSVYVFRYFKGDSSPLQFVDYSCNNNYCYYSITIN